MPDLSLALLLASNLACVDKDRTDSGTSSDSGTSDPWATAPTALRLGPPTPTVGAYSIAADPDTAQVYVSNLHVPFLTLIDSETGAWAGSLDLRDAGAEAAFFPRLFVLDRTLWVSDLKMGKLLRFSLPDHTPLTPVSLIKGTVALTRAEDGIWGVSGTTLTRYDGTGAVQTLTAPFAATALSVGADSIGLVDAPARELALLDRDGVTKWEQTVSEPQVEGILAWGDRLFIADRVLGDVIALEDGVEFARIHLGSDAFHLDRLDDTLIVTVRQGAALPESGAYQGDPGLIVALDSDLNMLWQTEVGKTVHFTAFDGERLWTMAEDSLQASAIDPSTGKELLRSPHLGLTLDHLQPVGDRVWLGSHLTDELWAVDLPGHGADTLQAQVIDVCGWPFRLVPDGCQGLVACQETGDVVVVNLDSDIVDDTSIEQTQDWDDTFDVPCQDGLCTGHSVFVGAAVQNDTVVLADPNTAGLMWMDGSQQVIGDPRALPDKLQHFDVVALIDDPLGPGLMAFEPRSQQIVWVQDGHANFAKAQSVAPAFPLVPDGDRVWAGRDAWKGGPTLVTSLPGGDGSTSDTELSTSAQVEAAGAGFLVVRDQDQLVVLDRDSLDELGRLALSELLLPPYLALSGDLGPLRLAVDEGVDSGSEAPTLLVGNLLRGTIEARALPDLAARGTGEIRALGRWADL